MIAPITKSRTFLVLSDAQSGTRPVVDAALCEAFEDLVDRAEKMLLMASPDELHCHADSNNPIAAWIGKLQELKRREKGAMTPAVHSQGVPLDHKRFEAAPCYRCGYNGAGYFQPGTHPCAAQYDPTYKSPQARTADRD